jgi:hypothetical protein
MFDKLFLLFGTGDDLEQRTILVEQQIRVSVLKLSRAFRSQHEQFLPSAG